MTLEISTHDGITVIMWIIGGVLSLLFAIIFDIARSGAKIKTTQSDHGERIAKVEVMVKSGIDSASRVEAKINKIEDKIDTLLLNGHLRK